jgi:ssDNA-binding Zn-finger/Zn-ribbon topoisomerase 1
MCPACNVEMVVVEGGEKRSLSYDTCESCGGIFVDGAEDDPPESIAWPAAESELVAFFKAFSKKK